MALTKYVVKKHDTKINRIRKLTRYAAELTFLLCINMLITKGTWPTKMAIIRNKQYNKYFLQRIGFFVSVISQK